MAWLTATYRITAGKDDIERRAAALAIEQSIECPPEAVSDQRVLDEIVARVQGIEAIDETAYRVRIALAGETIGSEPAQFLTMVAGNCSLWDDVELLDVALTPNIEANFPGPRHGVAGIRSLVDAPVRPLTCTALKPQGLPVSDLVRLAETFARGGVDIIKDDHGIGDQAYSPFAQRVPALQTAIERAAQHTGKRAFYAPNVTGTPRRLRERAALAQSLGVRVILVEPMVIGLPAFYDLVDEFSDLVYLAHPAFGGSARISARFVFGKLLRLFGADAVIFVNFGGRFAYPPEVCAAIAASLREPWNGFAPALPVPAGGMLVERVPELLDFYGNDSMMLIGGNLLVARDRLLERTRDYVARVHAHVP